MTGLNSSALAVFPQRIHPETAQCLKAPFLFNINTSPITFIAESQKSHQQKNADDTQRFIALSAHSLPQSLLPGKIVFLTFVPGSIITVWLSTQIKLKRFSSALAINLVLYPLSHISYCRHLGTAVKKVKFLGATLTQQLTLQDHVNTVCGAFFYHLLYFRIMLTQYVVLPSITSTLQFRLASSYSGYNNNSWQRTYVVIGANCTSRLKHTLAKRHQPSSIFKSKSPLVAQLACSITYSPQSLFFIAYQSYQTFQSFTSTASSYLSYTASHYLPTRALRSADTQLLTVPRARLVFADRGFYIAGPTESNNLASTVRSANSVGIFRSRYIYYE